MPATQTSSSQKPPAVAPTLRIIVLESEDQARQIRATGLQGAVTILITGNRQLRALNSHFRKGKYATDVLSFPAPPFSNGFEGDVAISIDIAADNARVLGHSVEDELRVLILHGVLHLAGYDHESDDGEMGEKELQLRKKLGLPVALIQRAEKPKSKRRSLARSRL